MMVADFSGLAGWLAIVHKSYGRWDLFQWAQWHDAWVKHCLETGNMKFIDMTLRSAPTVNSVAAHTSDVFTLA